MFFACFFFLGCTYFFGCASSSPNKGKLHQIPSVKVLDFMKKYGYIQMDDGDSEALYTEEGISEIIKTMQKYGGINETGKFDEATLKVFSISNWPPRLGEALVEKNIQKALDIWGGYGRLQFYKKYSQDADIIVLFARGYHGDSNPFDGPGSILAHAFFPHEADQLGGDIHFDADEDWTDKSIKEEDSDGKDFFTVALHELGHSLGLAHSPVPNSIMFPYYQSPTSDIQLGYDDILAMYDMYIRRTLKEDKEAYTLSSRHKDEDITSTTPFTTEFSSQHTTENEESRIPTSPTTEYNPYSSTSFPESSTSYSSAYPDDISTVKYTGDDESVEVHKKHDTKHHIPATNAPSLPDICDGHVDSIATLRDELFIFRDQYVWRFHDKGRLLDGYPVKLTDMFPKLPSHIKKIDAAYQRPDGNIVLFTGNVFWTYNGEKFLDQSPEPLTHYGLPEYVNDIDAVQNWQRNSITYFFRGGLFWKFENNWVMVTEESPQPTPTIWFRCSENNNKIMKWFSSDP